MNRVLNNRTMPVLPDGSFDDFGLSCGPWPWLHPSDRMKYLLQCKHIRLMNQDALILGLMTGSFVDAVIAMMNDRHTLIFCESAIDALSHAALFPDTGARYASIGGKPNPQQPELIRAAAARMPQHSEIVSAMDADRGGAELAEMVRKAVALTGRSDLKFSL